MKTHKRNLLLGSATWALVLCIAGVVVAAPPGPKFSKSPKNNPFEKVAPGPSLTPAAKLNTAILGKVFKLQPKPALPIAKPIPGIKLLPKPMPKPYPKPHPTYYPMPIPVPVARPVVIPSTPIYQPNTTNPVPVADIRLVNPAENSVTLKYQLDDGQVRSLPAGYSVAINQVVVISFDRGGSAGRTRYTLSDGTYAFVAAGGAWDLVLRSSTDASMNGYADVAANPVPGN